MAKREFLMLAHNYVADKYSIGQWFMSEKLDGMRAFWDGGISRGLPASIVPFANTEKDARYKEPPIATGLWSRYGKVIVAPDWWLDLLPNFPLDGELWAGNNSWQKMSSIVKKINPDKDDWAKIQYLIFDSPALSKVLATGRINNTGFKKDIGRDVLPWALSRCKIHQCPYVVFEQVYGWLKQQIPTLPTLAIHHQQQLNWKTSVALGELNAALEEVTEKGGEGIMIRRPHSAWEPERSHYLLKIKKLSDAEGTVIGYTWGRETDLGSKLLGKMGALLLRLPNGKEFELSGFTDEERLMRLRYTMGDSVISEGQDWQELYDAAYKIGCLHPGERTAEDIENPKFPRGTVVTFKYRELTDDGKPKEARYWRKSQP